MLVLSIHSFSLSLSELIHHIVSFSKMCVQVAQLSRFARVTADKGYKL